MGNKESAEKAAKQEQRPSSVEGGDLYFRPADTANVPLWLKIIWKYVPWVIIKILMLVLQIVTTISCLPCFFLTSNGLNILGYIWSGEGKVNEEGEPTEYTWAMFLILLEFITILISTLKLNYFAFTFVFNMIVNSILILYPTHVNYCMYRYVHYIFNKEHLNAECDYNPPIHGGKAILTVMLNWFLLLPVVLCIGKGYYLWVESQAQAAAAVHGKAKEDQMFTFLTETLTFAYYLIIYEFGNLFRLFFMFFFAPLIFVNYYLHLSIYIQKVWDRWYRYL